MKEDIREMKGQHHRKKFTEGLLYNELILEALQIKPGQTVVDAGCGTGYMAKIFSDEVSQSGRVYALDPDKYFIEALKNKAQETNIKIIEADITEPTPLKDSSVDLLYISTVIHVFSQQQMDGFLREAKRLLKKDALLAVVEFEKKETPSGPPLESRYAPEDLKELVPLVPLNTVKVGAHFYMLIFQNKDSQKII
jgi:ubiquinone/menaquinone biosynthesis C-methylase UbiE